MTSLKDYLKSNKISITSIQKTANIPYASLNDVVNGKTDVDNASVKILRAISKSTGLTMDEVYDMAKSGDGIPSLDNGCVSINKGKFFLQYKNNKLELCKVNQVTRYYIKEIAETAIRNIERERKFKEWNWTIS